MKLSQFYYQIHQNWQSSVSSRQMLLVVKFERLKNKKAIHKKGRLINFSHFFIKNNTCVITFSIGFKLLDILSSKSNQALSLNTLVSITPTIFCNIEVAWRPKSLSNPDIPKVPTAFSIRGNNLVKLATSAKRENNCEIQFHEFFKDNNKLLMISNNNNIKLFHTLCFEIIPSLSNRYKHSGFGVG